MIAQDNKSSMLLFALLMLLNPGDFVENVPLDSSPAVASKCGGYGANIVGKMFKKVCIPSWAKQFSILSI